MTRVTNEIDELLAELRQAGEAPAEDLLERVKAQGAAVVQPLIAMALEDVSYEADEESQEADEDNPEVWAPVHAVRLLGDLRPAEAAEPLISLLGTDNEWMAEDLTETYGQIGEPALAPLRALLFDRSQGLWTRAHAADGLEKIAQLHPELSQQVIAALVARLAPEETQEPADETLNGLIVSRLLDLQADEARTAIMQAFDEDRVDLRVVNRDDVWRTGAPSPPRGADELVNRPLRLFLRCTACGYDRPHEVAKVLYDLGTAERRKRGEETPYDEIVIPQRITCPKCGAVDQYELTGEAHLAIAAQLLLRMARAEEKGKAPHAAEADEGPLVVSRFTAFGRDMHPLEARDLYREQVAAKPEDSGLRVRYANVLQSLGYDDAAGEQYRAAVELDPTNVEAEINLGMLAGDAGRDQEARHHFQRVIELAPQSRLPRADREEYLLYARERLGIPPLTPAASAPPAGRRPQPPRAAAPSTGARGPVRTQKVGRNEPCPCGSGKKYKKCCGR